ncbi:MAG TPA: N-acetyl-gamma-glutamyl-phosphate reductase [Clostridiales bacterium]|nr:N-acetyl-gamma-glutamyl-phosphate reductase [Clostridiales bacterium]
MESKKIKVGIIGATGYAGAELIRLLLKHPKLEIVALGSKSFEGTALPDVYPAFRGFCDLICEDNDAVIQKSDVVFAAVPHGLSQKLAFECYSKSKYFIDLGADFRLEDEEDYKAWYGLEFTHTELHKQAAYGLPELFREKIKGSKIIANPGCYPTSIALGLFPAIKQGLIDTDSIIIDSKSGVTGAGRNPTTTTHFAQCNENFNPYKIAEHRHTPEIEQTLSSAASKKVKVTFVPHLLPVNRGILSTMYASLKPGVSGDKIRQVYNDFYSNEPFVRVLPKGKTADIRSVRYTNICDISLHIDPRTSRLIVVSAIDNMVKGAAGQAVQNMNIILGIKEQTGLELIPPAF